MDKLPDELRGKIKEISILVSELEYHQWLKIVRVVNETFSCVANAMRINDQEFIRKKIELEMLRYYPSDRDTLRFATTEDRNRAIEVKALGE